MKRSWQWSRMSFAWIVVLVSLCGPYLWAQTLGNAPQLNTAVPGPCFLCVPGLFPSCAAHPYPPVTTNGVLETNAA